MTDWTETTEPTTTWEADEITVPKPGMQAGVVGDEWDEQWFVGVDFTPWTRTGNATSTWTENS